MATFASVAGVAPPDKDREGQLIIFDNYDMSPILLGTGKSERTSWCYFTEAAIKDLMATYVSIPRESVKVKVHWSDRDIEISGIPMVPGRTRE
jgi:hypothetical protein